MHRVYQSKFADKGEKPDSFRACLASVLDLTLRDVPPFEASQTDWQGYLIEFLFQYGLQLVDCNTSKPKGWSIINGMNAYGEGHNCVGYNGEVFHDPDPAAPGIITLNNIFTLKEVTTT